MMPNHMAARSIALFWCLAVSLTAGYLTLRFAAGDAIDAIGLIHAALVAITAFWLAWGVVLGLIGIVTGPTRLPIVGQPYDPEDLPRRTAILMPVCNEDPAPVVNRIGAMNESLDSLGVAERFDFLVLSDTRASDTAQSEFRHFEQLSLDPAIAGRIYYRRRLDNTARKAGNISDFIRTAGGAYEFALVLDADSLMEGATIVEMVHRMQADPDLGLLQSLPKLVNAHSHFGRLMQFSTAYFSRVFAEGTVAMQGGEGPFWGHNAMFRVRAFAASCGLPELSGPAPHGGHILSHDYVEAALLSRAGWKVRLDPDLEGSYEEGPENLIDFAKRDRRWCQGNLQHRKIIFAPGLKFWNRFTLLQGVMSYLGSPLWLMLLGLSLWVDREPLSRFNPGWGGPQPQDAALALAGLIIGLLVVPKLLIVVHGLISGRNAHFGGTFKVLGAALLELAVSTVQAPILLMLQTQSVLLVLSGRDGGWPLNRREAHAVPIDEAWQTTWWIVCVGVGMAGISLFIDPLMTLWLMPAACCMAISPFVIAFGSHPSTRAATAVHGSFTPVLESFNGLMVAQSGAAQPDPAFVSADLELEHA